MNITKLLILGALEQLGQGSGYDVMQDLQRKMVHKWIDVKTGSIYYTINQLEKEGAIQEIERVQEGKYPPKAIYQVTDEGRKLFDTLQEKAFLGLFPRFYGFKVALKFNQRKTSEEIRHFGERAIAVINKHLDAQRAYLHTLDPDSKQYQFDAFFIDHDRRLFQAEKAWIQDAVAWVESNQPQQEALETIGE